MYKMRGKKSILACFMIISMLGMGFTGYKVKANNNNVKTVYLHSERLEDIINEELEEAPNLIEVIESKINVKVTAFTLMKGNKKIGTLQTNEEIEEILEEIEKEFLEDDEGNLVSKDVDILEELNILKEDVYVEDISLKEDIIDYLRFGGKELKAHKIDVGESFSTIAETYNMDIEELEILNPDKDGDSLKTEDEVFIKRTKPLITVVITEEIELIEDIDYEIEVKEDANMIDTKSEIEVEGIVGKEKILTQIIRHNGKIIEEEIVNKEIIKEPINQVVVKGTKKIPETVATGSFDVPIHGKLTSPFGKRWGSMHKGIDIAQSHGSDIKASDGGTVSFSGVMGGYGNMIEIDHGNGYKTRYAHCSKLLLNVGQKVYQGQVIARLGSTGRSTGPHVHFEVIKNEVHQNPLNFVKL